MRSDDDDGMINDRPCKWSGTSMQDCAPTKEVRDRLQRARDDKERLNVLVAEYYQACMRYARRLRCIHFAPEDVVHQMFMKIARRQAALDRYTVSRAWIVTCLNNAWSDMCKKHRLDPRSLDPQLEAAMDAFNATNLIQTLRGILDLLERSVGNDPEQLLLFDDWRHRLLDLPFDDGELRKRFGHLLSSKRHRFAQDYDKKFALRIRRELGLPRLVEIAGSLTRRSAPPKDEEGAKKGTPQRDDDEPNGAIPSRTDRTDDTDREDP